MEEDLGSIKNELSFFFNVLRLSFDLINCSKTRLNESDNKLLITQYMCRNFGDILFSLMTISEAICSYPKE